MLASTRQDRKGIYWSYRQTNWSWISSDSYPDYLCLVSKIADDNSERKLQDKLCHWPLNTSLPHSQPASPLFFVAAHTNHQWQCSHPMPDPECLPLEQSLWSSFGNPPSLQQSSMGNTLWSYWINFGCLNCLCKGWSDYVLIKTNPTASDIYKTGVEELMIVLK